MCNFLKANYLNVIFKNKIQFYEKKYPGSIC